MCDPRVVLAPIAAANRRYDDPYPVERELENLCQLFLKRGRCLAGGMDHELAVGFPEGHNPMGLDVPVLNGWQRVLALAGVMVQYAFLSRRRRQSGV